jgi:uncharacterized protein (DUF362 family)
VAKSTPKEEGSDPPASCIMTFESSTVSVWKGAKDYGDRSATIDQVVAAIGALRLGLDFVRRGDRVVLKPNWVKEHDERFPGPDQWEHVVTHPDVIEGVIHWVAPRLSGTGSITICDAPQTDSSFSTLKRYCDLDAMLERCRNRWPSLTVEILDLRPEEWRSVDGVTVSKIELPGDPLGSTHVRLNEDSEFVGFHGLGQLYGASYNIAETNERHREKTHEYLLCRTPMDADVLINIPKLKCHKKVGMTCALKNLVGINANKNWLPHHTEGTPEQGGDQFPRATLKARLEHSWMGKIKRLLFGKDLLSKLFVPIKKIGRFIFGDTQKVVRSGNWHGNDTCWRMVADLNKCLFHYDGQGKHRTKPMRYLAVVDCIVAGEGNGPMAPDRKPCGIIVAGANPVAVDSVCCALMGFDWRKIRLLTGCFALTKLPIVHFAYEAIQIVSNHLPWNLPLSAFGREVGFNFRPHFGWVGAIEKGDIKSS